MSVFTEMALYSSNVAYTLLKNLHDKSKPENILTWKKKDI